MEEVNQECGYIPSHNCTPKHDILFLHFQFAGKIAAAREAIGDSDFFLVARTDARVSHCQGLWVDRHSLP